MIKNGLLNYKYWVVDKMNYEQAIIQLEYEHKQLMEDLLQFRQTTKNYRETSEYKVFETKDKILVTSIARVIKLQKDKYQKEIDDAVELKLKEMCVID